MTGKTLRVAIFGAGRWACKTHIPNLLRLPHVELAAVADVAPGRAREVAAEYGIARSYTDAYRMLEEEHLDILFSLVPAFARTDVEARAATAGLHLFSEKPQALDMATARRIDAAVQRAGVLSTVCFRERYRPLFQEARRLLADKQIIHVRFQHLGGLPPLESRVSAEERQTWNFQMHKSGGTAFDWGVHAVDYTRFMTGLDITAAQAFYYHPPEYNKPLSCSFNFQLETGATMGMTFQAAVATRTPEPPFTISYAGGRLALYMYDRLEVDGEVVYRAEDFDPWFEQDRVFVEAVRAGNSQGILNDYHDGLSSLAPVLAGWESARHSGELVDVLAFAAG